MIIGLSGYKQSGKSTVASHLIKEHGFGEISWAEPLKDIVGQRLLRIPYRNLYGTGTEKEEILPMWGRSAREILQVVGTNLFRDQFDPDIWVKLGMDRIEILRSVGRWRNFVISDCRFPNEAKAVEEAGGHMVRVSRIDDNGLIIGCERPSWLERFFLGKKKPHASEIALDDWPFKWHVVAHQGDIPALQIGITNIVNELKERD